MFEGLLRRFGYVKATERAVGSPFIDLFSNMMGGSPRADTGNMRQFLTRYADQAWLYSCISVISQKLASTPIRIYRRNKNDLEEQPTHPLKILLDSVNPHSDGYDLREATVGFMCLVGNAYWLLDGFVAGKPTELYVIPPSKVRVKADPKRYVTGYIFEEKPGVEGPTIPPEMILHFKTWNPINDFYGLPPISAARLSSTTLEKADEYNTRFFENAARPGGALMTEQSLEKSQVERIRIAWQARYGGSNNAFKTAILDSGLKWQPMSETHKDMQFQELKKMTREDILSVYHMPPIMVGVYDEANYANANIQRKIFWTDTVFPWMQKILSVINEKLVKPFDPSVEAAFDVSNIDDLKADMKIQAEEHEILTRSGVMTINEVRGIRKLPPVDWGDTWNTTFGVGPIGETSPPPAPSGSAAAPAPKTKIQTPVPVPSPAKASNGKGPDGPEPDPIPLPALNGPIPAPPEKTEEEKGYIRRSAIWEIFKGMTESHERKWRTTMARLFNDQEREVKENLSQYWEKRSVQARLDNGATIKAAIDVMLFDPSNARKQFRKGGRALMSKTLEQAALAEINRYDLGSFDLLDPAVVDWLDKKAFKFADEVNRATEDQIREALTFGVQNGESIDDITQRIESIFDQARGFRSERVARTEVVGSSNRGAFAAYEQSGVIQQTEWVATRDDKTRETHRRLDGARAALNTRFENGLRYPGDPNGPAEEVINCRCTVAPVIPDKR